jgi:hypothetical protein
MHLSRFITMATCAITRIRGLREGEGRRGEDQ